MNTGGGSIVAPLSAFDQASASRNNGRRRPQWSSGHATVPRTPPCACGDGFGQPRTGGTRHPYRWRIAQPDRPPIRNPVGAMIDQYYDPTPSSSLFGSDLDAANTTSEETPEESRRQPMRVIVFASQKGGSGKTTLCGQLAVEADRAGAGPVALIDTDPQGSLADWWNARASDTPAFVKTSFAHMKEDLEELRAQGTKLVFIDTPPAVADTIKAVVGHADLVVIPTRPSPHDLRAVGATVDIIEGLGKPLVLPSTARRLARGSPARPPSRCRSTVRVWVWYGKSKSLI